MDPVNHRFVTGITTPGPCGATGRASPSGRDRARIAERARRGERFTVLYRDKPVCRPVPIESADLAVGQV